MSRPLRIDYPNVWHHVMNRARRGEALFEEKADYQQCIDLVQETADLFQVVKSVSINSVFDSILALRAADQSWCRFWVEPIQFCQQRGNARKNKVAKK